MPQAQEALESAQMRTSKLLCQTVYWNHVHLIINLQHALVYTVQIKGTRSFSRPHL
jgi:hypothetical protein